MNNLEYCSLLSYSPRGTTPECQRSQEVMTFIKGDKYVNTPPIPASDWIANVLEERKNSLPFISFFQPDAFLVPVPKSSLMRPDTLWVSDRIAKALARKGFGASVVQYLERAVPIRKAATSLAANRPRVSEHFQTMAVRTSLAPPTEILLIDDIITRGATVFGAALRLLDAFPAVRVRVFAAMQTISNAAEFTNFYYPHVGTITYYQDRDSTHRT